MATRKTDAPMNPFPTRSSPEEGLVRMETVKVKRRRLASNPPQQEASDTLKDHEVAQIINQVCEIARQFHATQQLRARIASVLVRVLTRTVTTSLSGAASTAQVQLGADVADPNSRSYSKEALAPEKCQCCGEGAATLHYREGLFSRLCNHCGSDYAGGMELWLNLVVSKYCANSPQQDQQMSTPAGWKLVPVNPTQEMIRAGLDAPAYGHPETASPGYDDVYKAMVAAAPTYQGASE